MENLVEPERKNRPGTREAIKGLLADIDACLAEVEGESNDRANSA